MAKTRPIIAAMSALCLSGCGTAFDYSSAWRHSVPDMYTPNQALRAARDAENTYNQRANNAVSAELAFDLPGMVGAIGAVAGAVFRASNPEIEIFGLTGAGSLAVGAYLDPKNRSQTYRKGSQAMGCLAGLAWDASRFLYRGSDVTPQTQHLSRAFQVLLHLRTAAGLSPDQQASLQTLADMASKSGEALSGAVRSVDTAVFTQAMSKLTPPNSQSLATQLSTEIQLANMAKASGTQAVATNGGAMATMALNATEPALVTPEQVAADTAPPGALAPPPAAAGPVTLAPPEKLTAAQVLDNLGYLIDFAANFQKSITACTGLVSAN